MHRQDLGRRPHRTARRIQYNLGRSLAERLRLTITELRMASEH